MLTRINATSRRQPELIRDAADPKDKITRITWLLAFLTLVFIFWVLWRYGLANESLLRAPSWLTDFLGLLTAAGLLTLVTLWGLVAWQRTELSRDRMAQKMTLEELYSLSPRDFEHYVAGLFERRGYIVEVRGRAGDLGVDLALTRADGRNAIVQCKRYRHTIGPDIIRELFGTMVHERAVHGFLVTTADISDGARAWAADKPITLIDGRTLAKLGADA